MVEEIQENQNPKEVINPATPKNYWKVGFLVLLGLFLICGLVFVGYTLGKKQTAKNVVPNLVSSQQTNETDLAPTETVDETANWKTYTLAKINLEFKLPPELSRLGNLKEEIIAGEKGSAFCASFPQKTSWLIKTAYAGGMGCYVNTFGLGGTSVDFEAGRSSLFTDYHGFAIENGQYLAKFVRNEKVAIRQDLVKEITNRYGVTLLRIIGQKQSGDSPFPVPGTPGEGLVGALVNLPENGTYQGLAIEMKLENGLTVDLFDQILSTFKFLK